MFSDDALVQRFHDVNRLQQTIDIELMLTEITDRRQTADNVMITPSVDKAFTKNRSGNKAKSRVLRIFHYRSNGDGLLTDSKINITRRIIFLGVEYMKKTAAKNSHSIHALLI